jgi:endonuclease YncB( thermonuclease family)
MVGNSLRAAVAAAGLFLSLSLPGALLAQDIRVIDGDTFDVGPERLRLLNIDAPETGQSCTDARGRAYDCGGDAADALRGLIRQGPLRCEGKSRDDYGRLLARCDIKGIDIAGALVAQGHALAFVRYSDEYLPQQAEAEKAGPGLWQGGFTAPWEFRAERWAAAPAGLAEMPDGCIIKGNINARGERIYHAPWSRSYDETQVTAARGERWFCTEGEAVAAGWRPPYR